MTERLSLVIPTYNEAKNIKEICARLLEILTKQSIDFEIIIVDDDSNDGTWQIAKSLSEEKKSIKLIRRTEPRDLSAAVVAGWTPAEGNILGVIDGDLQHPPEVLTSMINKMLDDKDIDIVVASRNVMGGGVSRWSLWRRFVSWSATLISAFFLPGLLAKIKDPMSGYFILRRRVIEGKALAPVGYKILLGVLGKGNYKKVVEVPYVFNERKKGGSKAGLKQYLVSLIYILRLSFQTGEIYRVAKYACVGFSGVFVTISGFLLFDNLLHISHLLSYIFATEFAILTNFILNDLWTFQDKARAEPNFKHRIIRLARYNLICLNGALISGLLFIFCTNIINIKPNYSASIGAGLAFLWNFILSTNIVWISGLPQGKHEVEAGYYHWILENNKIQRYWHHTKFDIISKKIGRSPVVDIGSGPGVFFYLNHNFEGIKVNLDHSYAQLLYSKTLNPSVYHVNATAQNLPFASESLGTVCLIEMIEHCKPEEAAQIMSEVYRVVKKGGKIIISTPNYKSGWPLLEFIISVFGSVNYCAQHITHFDIDKLTKLIESYGFTVKNKETFFLLSPFLASISERFSNIVFDIERKLFPKWGVLVLIESIKDDK